MHSDRLRRIIELKERLMEEKERVLEEHTKLMDYTISNIKSLDIEINVRYDDICTRTLNGSEFSSLKDYLEYLGRLKTEALAQKVLLQGKIAVIRAELYDMFKEIKMLNTLKKRIFSAARRAQNKKQQKLLDEIALRLEGRKL